MQRQKKVYWMTVCWEKKSHSKQTSSTPTPTPPECPKSFLSIPPWPYWTSRTDSYTQGVHLGSLMSLEFCLGVCLSLVGRKQHLRPQLLGTQLTAPGKGSQEAARLPEEGNRLGSQPLTACQTDYSVSGCGQMSSIPRPECTSPSFPKLLSIPYPLPQTLHSQLSRKYHRHCTHHRFSDFSS